MRQLLVMIILLITSLNWLAAAPANSLTKDSLSMEYVVVSLEEELKQTLFDYQKKLNDLYEQLSQVNRQVRDISDGKLANQEAIEVLTRKILLTEEKVIVLNTLSIDLAKIRYKKGIEVIKILYEKVLGLDHHFTSLKTHQSIQLMANPNSYPGFQNTGKIMQERLYKKSSINIPSLLESNGYVSAIFSLVSGFFGDGKPVERQAELDDVSCILDFTLKMSNELNTIYYETQFLITNNNKLREDCIELFDNFTEVINYKTRLDKCRDTDDWETIDELLDKFIEDIKSAEATGDQRLIQSVVTKGHINMEFAIDRLLDYLNKYADFINQGENYYKKFAVVVDSYDNETACAGKLPMQFSALKDEIKFSIDKFIQAYDIAELKGSKLKDLLYGYN